MVKVLEAVTDIDLRYRIRDMMALEAEFIETEGLRAPKVLPALWTPYSLALAQSPYRSASHRQAAFKSASNEQNAAVGRLTTAARVPRSVSRGRM